MRHRSSAARVAAASVLALTVLLGGCSADGVVADPDFLGGATPHPESTFTPAPGSWADAVVPEDYRVVALSVASDPSAGTVLEAVHEWALDHGAVLDAVEVSDADELERAAVAAAESDVDLVIGAGARTVDVLSLVTAQFLDQQFLILAAQLAEPTANVTAVIWPGAGFRGTGITADGEADTTAVTPERASEAMSAGYASVAWGITGVVVRLP